MTASIYANATSAGERVLAAIVYNLQTVISVANGYRNDIAMVTTEPLTQPEMNNFPHINIILGKETPENKDMSDQLWHKLLPISLMCFIKADGTTTADRLSLKEDLEYFIGNNWMLKGSDGIETCRIAILSGYEPFGMFLNQPVVGFMFGILVRYAQDIKDPSVLK